MAEYKDRWLSVEEICRHLGVSNDTIYSWIGKRNMPAYRMGRRWRFLQMEVDQWVKSGRGSTLPKREEPHPVESISE